MEASRYIIRPFGLVAILTIISLGGVAEADCYNDCVRACMQGCPSCGGSCSLSCASMCKDTSSFPREIGNTLLRYEHMNANHYCKLGCASSVCSAISTTLRLHSSAGSDHVGENAVKESVKSCNNACSDVCTKRFSASAVTA